MPLKPDVTPGPAGLVTSANANAGRKSWWMPHALVFGLSQQSRRKFLFKRVFAEFPRTARDSGKDVSVVYEAAASVISAKSRFYNNQINRSAADALQ